MSEAKKNETLSLTDLSARIVAEAENEKPDAAKLLGWVQDVAALAGTGREADQQLRDQTFLVAEQKLVDLHDVPSLVKLLAVKARWTGNRPLYGTECATVLASATKDRLVSAKIAAAGFGSRRPLEALVVFVDFPRRLRKAGHMVAPGVFDGARVQRVEGQDARQRAARLVRVVNLKALGARVQHHEPAGMDRLQPGGNMRRVGGDGNPPFGEFPLPAIDGHGA